MIARKFRALIRPCARTVAAAPVCAALLIGGCSSFNLFGEDADETYIEGSVEQLYNRGMDLIEEREYVEAATFFSEVDRQHPYSVWAPRSQLMVAYANYRAKDFETARLTLDRYLRLNPAHRDVPYAHYLKALCFFQEVRDTKRDPGPTAAAYEEFTLVVERFPASKYADDARRKAAVLRDHLVGHEMEVGRYYQGKNQHLAAINRFKAVVQEYQGSRYIPEALHRMTESYVALGLRSEAERTTAVLGRNFPKSRWHGHSRALLKGERTAPVKAASVTAAPAGGTEKKKTGEKEETGKPPPEAAAKDSGKSWFGRLIDRIF